MFAGSRAMQELSLSMGRRLRTHSAPQLQAAVATRWSTGVHKQRDCAGSLVLKDFGPSFKGLPLKEPTNFLKRKTGASLRARNTLAQVQKLLPAGLDRPFTPGQQGIKFMCPKARYA